MSVYIFFMFDQNTAMGSLCTPFENNYCCLLINYRTWSRIFLNRRSWALWLSWRVSTMSCASQNSLALWYVLKAVHKHWQLSQRHQKTAHFTFHLIMSFSLSNVLFLDIVLFIGFMTQCSYFLPNFLISLHYTFSLTSLFSFSVCYLFVTETKSFF